MDLKDAIKTVNDNLDESTRKLFLSYLTDLLTGVEEADGFIDPLDVDYHALKEDIIKLELRNRVASAFYSVVKNALTKALMLT